MADVPAPPALNPAQTVPVGTPTSLAGTITHTGTQDIENMYVDWGGGSGADIGECGLPPFGPGGPECNPGWTAVPGAISQTAAGALTLTSDAGNTNIALSDTHTYASAGTYYATVTVSDQSGATVSQTVVETVTDPTPTVTSLAPASAPIGSSPSVTITGGGLVPGSTVEWDGTPITTTYVPPTLFSPASLTAQVPATDTASTTAAAITVVNAAPGGGTSSPQVVYIVPAQSAIAGANLATSASATGSATAAFGGSGAGTATSLSAAASGAGTVALAQYTADPESTTPPPAVNAYFNVLVPASSSFCSVQVTDCNLGGGSVVYYYDPTTTECAEVSGQSYNAGTGCVTFALGTASTLSLSQLSTTVFGVQDVPPSLTLPGDQSVTYHEGLSFSTSDPQPSDVLMLSATGHAQHDAHLVGQQVGQIEPALGRRNAELQGLRSDVPQRGRHRYRPGLRRDLDGQGGGSAALPSSVPAYMAVVVPNKVTQSGSTISGNVAEVVIVKTNAGYQPDPCHPGTGTVVGALCGS